MLQDFAISDGVLHRVAILACVLTAACVAPARGQTPAIETPRTSRPLAAERIATVHWEQVPLRDALRRLSMVLDTPVFVDRRVDPGRRISLDLKNAPAEEVLSRTAEAASMGTTRLGRLFYFGPVASARSLRTIAALRGEEIARLPTELAAPLKREQPLEWQRLTEPRELVKRAIEERGWRLARGELIPHDLWLAGQLPAMSLADQLTVLLVGFNLTFSANSGQGTIEIIPLTGEPKLPRRYSLDGQLNQALIEQKFPQANVFVDGDELVVSAIIEEHEQIAELAGKSPRQPTEPRSERDAPRSTRAQQKQVYTLRVEEQPVGAVLRQLGQRLGWVVEFDEPAIKAAGLSLDKRISFSVQLADEEELLTALLRPAGLGFRREGNRVTVVPDVQSGD